jgi:hypothetical protein
MAEVIEALIFDLLEWVAKGERSYEETFGAEYDAYCHRVRRGWPSARGVLQRQIRNGHCAGVNVRRWRKTTRPWPWLSRRT